MRLYVANSQSPIALALEVGFYVFDRDNIVYKTDKGVFLYHNDAVPSGTNIVDVFTSNNPGIPYRSVTELKLDEVIAPLRKRINFITS